MNNKDMRRLARNLWKKNWFTIFLSYIAGILGFVLLTMLFSSLLNPFILFTTDFSLGALRRGIGLSLTGILTALYFFVCIFYFIVLGFSYRKMLLEMSKGEKKVNAAMIFYGFHPKSFPILGRMLSFTVLTFLFSILLSVGQEAIEYFLGEGIWYWAFYAISLLFLIIFSLYFDMTPYTIWDQEGKSLWQNMKKSAAVMKGQKFRYFRQQLYFTLVSAFYVFITAIWSFILKSPILPVFFVTIYLSIYLIPYKDFVQTLVYRNGMGESPSEVRESTELRNSSEVRESTELRNSSEVRESTELRNSSEVQKSTELRDSSEVQEPTKLRDSSEPRDLIELQNTKESQNSTGLDLLVSTDRDYEDVIKPEVRSEVDIDGQTKPETDSESKPEVSGEEQSEMDREKESGNNCETKPENDGEHKNGEKMSFEEARRQYTDYEE